MTEIQLAGVIFYLCVKFKGEALDVCIDTYVNCAVKDRILTKEEFDKQCKGKFSEKGANND